jgi:hypothetical protein
VTRQQRMGEQSRPFTWPDVNVLRRFSNMPIPFMKLPRMLVSVHFRDKWTLPICCLRKHLDKRMLDFYDVVGIRSEPDVF